MADLSDFLPEVLPDCPGVPTLVAERAVLNACREFCSHTLIVRETLAAIDIVADQRPYPLTLASGMEGITALSVMYDSAPLWPAGEDNLDFFAPTWRNTDGGAARRYHFTSPETLNLTFDPDVAVTDGLIVVMAEKPSMGQTTVAELLYDDWHEGIAAGAKNRLMKMKNQQWSVSDAERRSTQIEWKNCLIDGYSVSKRSWTRQDLRVRPRPIALGSQSRGGGW